MSVKIQDSELRIMNLLWEQGDLPAKQISDILGQEIGWNINTTYTLIKRLIAKGAIERKEPKFICHALVSRKENQRAETAEFVNKLYGGSRSWLFASLLEDEPLTQDQLEELKRYIAERTEDASD